MKILEGVAALIYLDLSIVMRPECSIIWPMYAMHEASEYYCLHKIKLIYVLQE